MKLTDLIEGGDLKVTYYVAFIHVPHKVLYWAETTAGSEAEAIRNVSHIIQQFTKRHKFPTPRKSDFTAQNVLCTTQQMELAGFKAQYANAKPVHYTVYKVDRVPKHVNESPIMEGAVGDFLQREKMRTKAVSIQMRFNKLDKRGRIHKYEYKNIYALLKDAVTQFRSGQWSEMSKTLLILSGILEKYE